MTGRQPGRRRGRAAGWPAQQGGTTQTMPQQPPSRPASVPPAASTEAARQALAQQAQQGPRGEDPVLTIRRYLKSMEREIAQALPRHLTAERLIRMALTLIRYNPKLLECSIQSLLGAIMLAAQLGLEPGPLGHCYFVPFWNKKTGSFEVQFIVGYKGYLDLAWRSGRLLSIAVREVCQNDKFQFRFGLNDVLIHEPALENRGEPTRWYLVAQFKDGGYHIDVVGKQEVEERRARSRAANDGPWVTDYNEMAKKTVIRKNSRYLPLSAEHQLALAVDEGVPRGLGELETEHGEVIDTRAISIVDAAAPAPANGEAQAQPAGQPAQTAAPAPAPPATPAPAPPAAPAATDAQAPASQPTAEVAAAAPPAPEAPPEAKKDPETLI